MKIWLVMLALAAMTFAGCNDEPAQQANSGDGYGKFNVVVDEQKGMLRGVVVDEAIRPIPGAQVRVSSPSGEEQSATTEEDGLFAFGSLVPGTYVVLVEKPGYAAAQTSNDVEAGVAEPQALRIVLQSDPTSQPHFQVQKAAGFIECSVRATVPGVTGTGVGFGPCAGATVMGIYTGPIGNDATQVSVPFDSAPTFFQAEMQWSSTQSTGSGLSLVVGPPLAEESTFCQDVVWGRHDGTAPLVVRLNETVLQENVEDGSDKGACMRAFSYLAPETAGAFGMAISQEFEIFATTFYNFEPEEGWTFIEHGEPALPA